jgi:hypothetical protein
MESQPQPQLPRPISRIFFRGCSEEAQSALRSRMPIHEGAVLSDELLQSALHVAKAFNLGLEILVSGAVSPEDYLKLPPELRKRVMPPTSDDGVNVTIYDPASLPQRIRIEGSVQESMLIARVPPVYPREACEDEGDPGEVKLSVVIGKDGSVMNADPVAGPELLVPAAVDAAKQWKYRPTLLNGLPVEVQTIVQMSFRRDR